jgi:hypothetical protein
MMRENTLSRKDKARRVVGWIAVGITAVYTNLWTYWGIVENFHEGWYSTSIFENLLMLFIQYLLFTIAFVVLALVSIRWPKAGLGLHIAVGLFFAWFFNSASFNVVGIMIVIPILALGLLYFFGRPEPRKWAYRIIVILPLLIILSVTPYKLIQVSQRVDDGDFGPRTVEGNGVTLTWAPRGPGWPDGGISYDEAVERCRYLLEDGMTVTDEIQDIWRVPTVDEAVRSMMLHNENAGGVWDPDAEKAAYEKRPDKETPLWDPHSKIIYYWVQGNAGAGEAYIIVYHGGVYTRKSDSHYGYLTFRAVKDGESSIE